MNRPALQAKSSSPTSKVIQIHPDPSDKYSKTQRHRDYLRVCLKMLFCDVPRTRKQMRRWLGTNKNKKNCVKEMTPWVS